MVLEEKVDLQEDPENELFQAVASSMIRISCLEKVLIDSGIIDKEKYIAILKEATSEFRKVTQGMVAERFIKNKKMLS